MKSKSSIPFKFWFYILIGFLVCGLVVFEEMVIADSLIADEQKILELEQITGDIRYYDEVLTMSARMAAFTGDKAWQDRYDDHVGKLDVVIEKAVAYGDLGGSKTDEANQKLIQIESEAFKLVDAGRLEEAQALLLSERYLQYKKEYAKGLNGFFVKANWKIESIKQKHIMWIRLIELISVLGVGFIVISTYIGFKSLISSYRQQKVALEYRRMASLGRLSAGMAHEINNALQPIMGLSDILRTRLKKLEKDEEPKRDAMGTPTKSNADHAEMIYENAIYAREIVENILDHSKGIQSQQEAYVAREVLDEAIDFASQSIPGSMSLYKKLTFIDEDINIRVNKTDVTQIIKNILLNAAHAVNEKGQVDLVASLKDVAGNEAKILDLAPQTYCILSIQDRGTGMDKKTMQSIFDPFFTTKVDEGGTGLGLSVSYGMMKQMSGAINVESKKGQGSIFYLYFPVAE